MNKDSFNGTLDDLTRVLVGEFQEKKMPHLVRREATFFKVADKAQVAIGMRRTGKTYFLYQKIKDILDAGVPITRVLYLNLEDDRMLPLTNKELGTMVDIFYALYPENHDGKCYLFFDEIQNVEDWALVIRRLLDTKNVEIYLSGSSAKLLSQEIATQLRGRAVSTEIWPFSWTEYLAAKKIDKPPSVLSPKRRDIYLKHFRDYLLTGGFPEVIGYADDLRLSVLQEYTHTVTFRDIVERYEITNLIVLKTLIKTLLKSVGSRFSANKCFKDFKSQGLVVGKNTIHDYFAHIRDAYLAFDCLLFTENLRRQNTNPRKIYAIDTGLALANTLNLNEKWGALFENLIYIDLRRQKREVYYHLTQDDYEIDFVSRSIQGRIDLYQICWDYSHPPTYQREQRALSAAAKELKIKGRLVTPFNYIAGEFANF